MAVAEELDDKLFKNFETSLWKYKQDILDVCNENLLFKKPNAQNNLVFDFNCEEQLQTLSNDNKTLRKEIDDKIKELAELQHQYETYNRDRKLLANEIKEKHDSFLLARRCYKKYLNFNYSIESKENEHQIVLVQFFTESKKANDKYCVRLKRNSETSKYELMSMNPPLDIIKHAQEILKENNNVPGALAYIRQELVAYKNRRK